MATTNKASKIKEVEDRILPVSEVDPFVRILVQGPNKRGKTVFGTSGPKTILLDINEKGSKSISGRDVDIFPANNWADVVYFYWYLRAGKHPYEVLCVDTVDQMQHVCMQQVLKEGADRDPYRDPKTPAQRDWLKMAELMKPQILHFRNLPMHCVFLVQEREVTDDDTATTMVVPNVSPGVRGTLQSCVDAHGRVFVKQGRVAVKGKERKVWEHYMLVGEHDRYPTGNRLDLPVLLKNPTMSQFIAANEKRRKHNG